MRPSTVVSSHMGRGLCRSLFFRSEIQATLGRRFPQSLGHSLPSSQKRASFFRDLLHRVPSGSRKRFGVAVAVACVAYKSLGTAKESKRIVRCDLKTGGEDTEEGDELVEVSMRKGGKVLRRSFWEWVVHCWHMLRRGFVLAGALLPLGLSAPLCFSWGGVYRKWWVERLADTFRRLGPAFIKLGQWIGARPDLFPPDLVHAMESLHQNAPEHSFGHTAEEIERAFGVPWKDLFEEVERKPLGSGSIAQVHKAKIRRDAPESLVGRPGAVVAVKVQHPGVSENLETDFAILSAILPLLPGLKAYRVPEMLSSLQSSLSAQLDFRKEADALELMGKNFGRWKLVSLPTPIRPLVGPSVLVESFEAGAPLSDFVRPGNGVEETRIARQVARLGVFVLLKMMLVDGVLHGDLHPGNIMVRLEQKEAGTGEGNGKDRLTLLISAFRNLCGNRDLGKEKGERDGLPPAKNGDAMNGGGEEKSTEGIGGQRQDVSVSTGSGRERGGGSRAHLVLLDVGMTEHLSSAETQTLRRLFGGLSGLVGEAVCDAICALSPEVLSSERRTEFISQMDRALGRQRLAEEKSERRLADRRGTGDGSIERKGEGGLEKMDEWWRELCFEGERLEGACRNHAFEAQREERLVKNQRLVPEREREEATSSSMPVSRPSKADILLLPLEEDLQLNSEVCSSLWLASDSHTEASSSVCKESLAVGLEKSIDGKGGESMDVCVSVPSQADACSINGREGCQREGEVKLETDMKGREGENEEDPRTTIFGNTRIAAAMECCRQNRVLVEGKLCLVVVTAMMCEAMQRTMYPSMDVYEMVDNICHAVGVTDALATRIPGLRTALDRFLAWAAGVCSSL